MTHRPTLIAVLVSASFLASCGGDGDSSTQPPPTPTVASVRVAPATAELAAGETTQLSATPLDASGAAVPGKTPSWSSNAAGVATVSSTGLVTAVSAGSATVTATVDGRSGSAAITVTPPPVASVEIDMESAEIFEGASLQLGVTVRDGQGNELTDREVTWSSSAPAVATVDDTGLVTGVAAGSATITATAEGVSASVAVEVQQKPVAAVEITPEAPSLFVGGTVQLTATTLDDEGNELTDREVLWSTSAPGVASVDDTGLVTGEGPGETEITATSEQVTGTVTVTVEAPPPLALTGVSPDPLVEGQAATLTGTGFAPTPEGNTVTVGGSVAVVTMASITSLEIVVPETACRPTRMEAVQVSVGQTSSEALDVTVRPATVLEMAVGDLVTLQDASNLCLQFDESGSAERYVFGVQAVSENPTDLTPVQMTATIPAAASAGRALPLSAATAALGAGPVDPRSPKLLRWARHRSAEIARKAKVRPLTDDLLASGRFRPTPAFRSEPARIPGDVEVGTEIDLKFPDFDTNACTTSFPMTVVVKTVSERTIVVEDTNAPAGGFSDTDYEELAADFDDPIYQLDTDFLGEPSDMDANGRIVVIITPEVNERQSGALAFVSPVDLFPVATCPSSNEGEYYYARAPDPTGMFAAGVYSLEDAQNDRRTLLAHEFAHVIQLSRRMAAGGQRMASFMEEGQATAMEQFNGFNFEGRTGGQNLSGDIVYFTDPNDYYLFTGDVLAWFGWDFVDSQVDGAPEECTWVASAAGSPGPCGENTTRMVYGPTWAIVQHAIDRYGDGLGGDKAIHRALVDYTGTPGFAAFESVFGMPMGDLLAPAAAMLLIDDRYTGPSLADHQFRNFDLRSIAAAWQDPDADLQERVHTFGPFQTSFSVRAGSSSYHDISGASRPATAVRVTGQGEAELPAFMQVWIVRVQ